MAFLLFERRRRKPNLIDMTGRVCGGWTVERQAVTVSNRARWHAVHKCGGRAIVDAFQLRARPPKYCDNCRPKRRESAA